MLPKARVEHIGASSIPLAISKGDLDIFIGVESDELEAAVQLLTTLGFQEKPTP
ncbi:GrpB family protein [Aeromonas sp. sia0103]|uniref:GrpB family protein n=1 Tax=Aeromonas sp. sia0103 TaxID=2854782 RepID=UPI003528935B